MRRSTFDFSHKRFLWSISREVVSGFDSERSTISFCLFSHDVWEVKCLEKRTKSCTISCCFFYIGLEIYCFEIGAIFPPQGNYVLSWLWKHHAQGPHFKHTFLLLFQTFQAIDRRGYLYSVYFVSLIVIGSFFMLNLVLGVLSGWVEKNERDY